MTGTALHAGDASFPPRQPAPQLDPRLADMLPDPTIDPFGFLVGAADAGDVISYTVAGQDRVLVTDPAATHEVLTAWPEASRTTPITQVARALIGDGLITSVAPYWRPRRLVIQRELSFRNVRRHAELFARNTEEHLRSWQVDGAIDIQAAMVRLALDNLGDSVFAADFREYRDLISAALATSQRAIDAVSAGSADPALDAGLEAAAARLDAFVQRLVSARTVAPGSGLDILGVLVERTGSGEQAFADPWLRDEAITLLMAGHETTALTATMALHLLARETEVADRLRAELSDAAARDVPAWALADEVPLARHVVEEALRLYPPLPALHRTAVRDVEIGGYTVPAGTTVVVSPWVLQRDARWWPEPERFDPWRFAGERRKPVPKLAYLPFGAGPRICAGNHFALLEAAVIVAATTLHFRLEEHTSVEPVLIDVGTALRCAHPLMADVRPTADAARLAAQ